MNPRQHRLVHPSRLLAALQAELQGSAHVMSAVSLALIDLDGMKHVNARFGYGTGTNLLLRVGRTLTERAPEAALLSRLGGDEFAIIMPECSSRVAVRRAGRLLRGLRMLSVECCHAPVSWVRASVGGATAPPGESSLEALMHGAHTALLEAKRQGGDRIVWS
jgi:diguanylate cyclase (GGDEF)-like protein